jgi:hypothetical protein
MPVESSRTPCSYVVMWSRDVSVFSSAMPPMTFLEVVTVSCSIAWM